MFSTATPSKIGYASATATATGRKSFARRLLSVGLLLALQTPALAARLEVMQWESRVLKNNPLHDPAVRRVAVFLPSQAVPGARLPVVYYLPGYGGSPGNFISHSNVWLTFTQQLADEVTPLTLVVVDGRTRWGGSQYLNSPAQGNYADYVCKEIVPMVEAQWPVPTNGMRRIIAGHSSGGFGALRLGMANPKLFDGVIALSPDSDFPVTHLPLVQLPGVTNATLAEVEAIAAMKAPRPTDGDLSYAIGLSAAYAPRGILHPGQFEWLYDARGDFRESVWQRWLANDPLTLVKRNPAAFSAKQAIYLDGAAQDEFLANIGARAIYGILRGCPERCAFNEPAGRHGDHIAERMECGLAWMFDRQPPEGRRGRFVNLGPQVTATAIQGSVFARDDSGRELIYTVVRGEPAHLLGYEVTTGKMLVDLPMPGSDGSWTTTVSSDNWLYTCGSNGHLFRLKPGTSLLEDLGQALPGETIIWDVCAGAAGEIFGATYPGCRVFRYSPKGGFSDVGRGPLVVGENYVRSVAYDEATGMVYAGVGSHAHLIELNPKTGEKRELLALRVKGEEAVYSLGVVHDRERGDRLLVWVTNRNKTIVDNLRTGEVERELPTEAVKSAIRSPNTEKVYYSNDHSLMSFDLEEPTEPARVITRCVGANATTWLATNDLCVLTAYAQLLHYDPASAKTGMLSLKVPPQPIPIQSLELGPDGKIWVGGFLAGGTVSFDPATGKTELFKGMSQIEHIGVLDGKMYFGIYPHARFYEFNPAKPWGDDNPRKIGQVPEQSRPIAVLGVPELSKVFIGTVPEYGLLGGHLIIYDPRSDMLDDEGELVSKQSVVSLVYAGKLIIGGTSIKGGLGIKPEAGHAKLFGWDPASRKKVFEIEPVPDGQAITCLIVGPDKNVWGVDNGTLFIFDPVSRKVLFTKKLLNVDTAANNYLLWRDAFMVVHPSGQIFATLDGELIQLDPATKNVTVLHDRDANLLTMDRNGRLYFRDKINLWQYTP